MWDRKWDFFFFRKVVIWTFTQLRLSSSHQFIFVRVSIFHNHIKFCLLEFVPVTHVIYTNPTITDTLCYKINSNFFSRLSKDSDKRHEHLCQNSVCVLVRQSFWEKNSSTMIVLGSKIIIHTAVCECVCWLCLYVCPAMFVCLSHCFVLSFPRAINYCLIFASWFNTYLNEMISALICEGQK